jgi:UDP-galactopyranose mutase
MNYDFLVVGAGLAGCVSAEHLSRYGTVLMVEKRDHIGGNCFDFYNEYGILIHKYGPHFFHTNNKVVFDYLSQFTDWHYYQHRVLAYINGRFVKFPSKAIEGCFSGYTKKQWGEWADKIYDSVPSRINVDKNDDRYFADKYQVMPLYGYSNMFISMTSNKNISILLKTDWQKVAGDIKYKLLVWTGRIDEFFDFQYGKLPFRSLGFETITLDMEFYQDAAQINYPIDYDFTRVIEIKHATGQTNPKTTIVREYPRQLGIPYYPIPCEETDEIYNKYSPLATNIRDVYFIGRLAEYAYLNMDEVVEKVISINDQKWKNHLS